jgi:hypothetical protein
LILVSPYKTAIKKLHDPHCDTTSQNENGGAICNVNSMTALRSRTEDENEGAIFLSNSHDRGAVENK